MLLFPQKHSSFKEVSVEFQWKDLPVVKGFHFVGPRDSHKWTEFVAFLRSPENGITIMRTMDSAPGEYKVYVTEEDEAKIHRWLSENGVEKAL